MIPFRLWFDAGGRDREFVRMAWILLAGATLLRAIVVWTLPLDLSGDEAYYWEWGRRLDWGYFSKPPGMAYLMAFAGYVGGGSAEGIRSFAVAFGAATAWCVHRLALEMYGARAAFLAIVAIVATPATVAMNVLLSVDVPLVFFWSAALLLFWRYVHAPRAATVVALALALTAGALIKQMMLVFPALAIVFATSTAQSRHVLARPAFWAALAAPFAGLIPAAWWNYRHDWITLRHTAHHFRPGSTPIADFVGRFFEFLGTQAGLLTPIGYALLIIVVAAAIVRWPRLAGRERFLAVFCAPGLAVTFAMTVRQEVIANWPAVYYVSGLVLLAGWVAGTWQTGPRVDSARRAAPAGLMLAIGLTVATYAGAYALALGIVDLGRLDPVSRIRGWKDVATAVQTVRERVPDPGRTMVVALSHRYLASELAFYLPDQPVVYHRPIGPAGGVQSQYDLWPGPESRIGDDALIVQSARHAPLAPEVRACFESVSKVDQLHVPRAHGEYQSLDLYLGRNLLHWPPAPNTVAR